MLKKLTKNNFIKKHMHYIIFVFILIILAIMFYKNNVLEGWVGSNCSVTWNSPQQTWDVPNNNIVSFKVTESGSSGNYTVNSGSTYNNVNYGGQSCKNACSTIAGCAGFILDTSANQCNFKNSMTGAQSTSYNYKWMNSFVPSCSVTGG